LPKYSHPIDKKLVKSSNPLNLEETRWEEEESTRWLHGMASNPEENVSGGLRRKKAGGKRQIRGQGGARW
jgi:hypothetical protein